MEKNIVNTNTYYGEEWERILFDGISENVIYEVSNYGRIRKKDSSLESWRIMKISTVKGYSYFSFVSNQDWTHPKSKTVHRLVAKYFCPKKSPDHKYVIHLDFQKKNNYFQNLAWVTKAEMYIHIGKNPDVNKKGEIRYSKLTETEVIRLKMKLKRNKNKLYKLAKEFGITHTQLNRIRSGENWGHIKID
ncbi:MAG: HNH endonuclease [Bacteroidales bacterium]|nr:HNH endonuclease [Bacteroidales bacterium]